VKKILALWFVDPHAARAFLIRTLRVAEDLHADLLHDLLAKAAERVAASSGWLGSRMSDWANRRLR